MHYGWHPNLPDEGDNHLIKLALAGGAQAIVTHNLRDLQGGELDLGSLHSLTNPQVSLPSDVPLPSWLIFDVQGMRFFDT